jgi:plasmid replication initiation protein
MEKDTEKSEKYVSKPYTWREAGWLPLLVAGVIVGIVFTIGMKSNADRLKTKRAAEQAAVDAKNGVVRPDIPVLKLVEEKSVASTDSSVVLTLKSVQELSDKLEITVNFQHKSKGNVQNLDFSLIDIAQNGKEIKAIELGKNLAENSNMDKKIHFQYTVGESRQFLLYGKFNIEGMAKEGNIAVPFQVKF